MKAPQSLKIAYLLCAMMLPAVVNAQYNYTINNGTITITGYTGSGGAVTIPSTINGLPVTSIGDQAFYYRTRLTSVTIPNSVTSIGDWGFENCYGLTNITIGNSVTSIGDYAFYNCHSLTSVAIPDSVTAIGDGAFYWCTSLTSVTIGNSIISIGDRAFSDCTSLPSVTIPNSVTSIGAGTFAECYSLTSIIIPASVASIGPYAFDSDLSLSAITVDALNSFFSSLDGVLFNKGQTTLLGYPGGKAGSDYTIPNSVTNIGDYAFYNCHSLTSVAIPDSVTAIGDGAFYWCTSLTSVTIGNSIISIGDFAFSGCTLISVTIPNGVKSLGAGAFDGCTSLTGITIGTNVISIGDYAFQDCTSLTSVTIPSGVTNIGAWAFQDCTNLTGITIGTNVTSIGDWAFQDCYSLTNITIPNSVTSIGDYAFYDCTSLSKVTIGNSITNIGDYAFSWCSNLTSVYFMGNAPIANSDVFYDSTNVTVYYLVGTTGWGSTFGGRPTALWAQPLAPSITTQPQSQTVTADANVTFTVVVAGVPPFNYQWQFNGQNIAGTNSATLTLNSFTAANSGGYSVIVSNPYGSVTSATASLAVLTDGANGNQPLPISGSDFPPKQPGKNNLVLVTHGWMQGLVPPPTVSWVADMSDNIQTHVSSDWQVVPYYWTTQAWTLPGDLLLVATKVYDNANTIGTKIGRQIAAQNWQHVHLIGHSAGAALINAAARKIKEISPSTEVHCTFLDPASFSLSERFTYGDGADWSDNYFSHDQASAFTDGKLSHAFNVDVGWVYLGFHPVFSLGGPVAYATHEWAHDFYNETVLGTVTNCALGLGFPLSKEGDGWNNRSEYPANNTPNTPCGRQSTIPPVLPPSELYASISVNQWPNAISQIGANLFGNWFTLGSSSSQQTPQRVKSVPIPLGGDTPSINTTTPAWLAVGLTITNPVNFIQFDAAFTDTNSAEGLLSVYWNTNQIGLVDEQVVSSNLQTYQFFLPSTVTDGVYTLSFRLDAFNDTSSSITVTNVATGFIGTTTPLALGISLTNGSPLLQLTGASNYNYLVQTSTNLVDWTPTALLLNTNGTVQFSDSAATNSTRFYRAVIP